MSNDLKAKAREAAMAAAKCSTSPAWEKVVGEALDAYERALSTPQSATRTVRIAVAEDGYGMTAVYDMSAVGGHEPTVWRSLAGDGYGHPIAIVTAHIPIRDVPEVPGDVEGV